MTIKIPAILTKLFSQGKSLAYSKANMTSAVSVVGS